MINMDYSIYKEYINVLERGSQQKGVLWTMCKALNNLERKTAEELLKFANISAMPVDLSKLLRHWGIFALAADFTKLQETDEFKEQVKNKGNILGAVAYKGDDLCIYYKHDDSIHRKRFTIAHELAHCCLDDGRLREDGTHYRFEKENDYAAEEIAANTFAGEILMPEKIVRSFLDMFTSPSIEDFARLFDVSENVARARLEVLLNKVRMGD